MNPDDAARVGQVADLLRGARSLLFVTGAGLSADSGLPTYRGIGGLYHDADPEDRRGAGRDLGGVQPVKEVSHARRAFREPSVAADR